MSKEHPPLLIVRCSIISSCGRCSRATCACAHHHPHPLSISRPYSAPHQCTPPQLALHSFACNCEHLSRRFMRSCTATCVVLVAPRSNHAQRLITPTTTHGTHTACCCVFSVRLRGSLLRGSRQQIRPSHALQLADHAMNPFPACPCLCSSDTY